MSLTERSDTACCSSSLMAHLACHRLPSRASRMSIAAGVHPTAPPDATVALSRYWMMAADGRCQSMGLGARQATRASATLVTAGGTPPMFVAAPELEEGGN